MSRVVLVTGASGSLGQAVVTALAATGTTAVPHHGLLEGDLTDARTCAEVITRVRPDAIVNTAGRTYGETADLMAANLLLPTRLADAIAAQSPTARLVLAGSAAEYGLTDKPGVRIDEKSPCRPNSDYGLSKLAATRLVALLLQNVCTARVFNLLDPEADARALLPRVRTAQETGSPLPPDAGAVRDWVTVEFVASALAALATVDHAPAVVNVCSGEGRSAAEMLGISAHLTPAAMTWSVGDPRLLEECTGLRAGAA